MGENREIIFYEAEDGEIGIEVTVEDDTVWLTQAQMSELFQRDKSVISKHITNIFRERELVEASVLTQLPVLARDNKIYETNFYNLDVIISIGYRIKSKRGTQFRIWATRKLREHLLSQVHHFKELYFEMLEGDTQDITETAGYIYVISSPTGLYKIGCTKNPETRFKTFKSLFPFPIECVSLTPADKMLETEAELHQLFADKRVNGEWFALNGKDLETLKGRLYVEIQPPLIAAPTYQADDQQAG